MPSSSGEISVSGMTARGSSAPPNVPADKIEAAAPKRVTPKVEAIRPPVSGETGPKKVFDDGKTPSEKLFDNLGKLADKPDPRDVARKAAADAKTAAEVLKAAAPAEGEEDFGEDPDLEGSPTTVTDKPAAPAGEKKKINPWTELKTHKQIVAQKEAELSELKKLVADPQARAAEVARLQAIEKRNQELEEQIKFVDYSKSKEYQEKYDQPYKAAWERAMGELSELTVSGNDGAERPMEPADLLQLVNLPLKDALVLAEETYGPAAQTVMNYRKEIKGLFQQQQQALADARKSGVEKSTADQTQQQAKMQALQQQAHTQWEQENARIVANETTGKYFKPVEGNDKINASLEKGYKFVDETMAVNPLNPNLSPEQRADAVRRHAALRHKAASWGRMRMEFESLQKDYQAALGRLKEFEGSVPGTGGDSTESGSAPAGSVNRMGSMMDRLGKLVKPG
jgi:hypothetical protein